jgi:hypothetical protein
MFFMEVEQDVAELFRRALPMDDTFLERVSALDGPSEGLRTARTLISSEGRQERETALLWTGLEAIRRAKQEGPWWNALGDGSSLDDEGHMG